MDVSIVPLSEALGAEVKGIDLREPLGEATVKTINDAFDRHIVLVFRAQELSEADQLRAAGYFGTVHVRRRPANARTPGGDYDTPFMLVTHIVENGKAIGAFGDARCGSITTPAIIRSRIVRRCSIPCGCRPPAGTPASPTCTKAYENIPRALRNRLEGRNVLQIHDYKRRERIDLDKVDLASIQHHEQPIFITHPATGRKALYISRLMSARIEGLSRQESEAALDVLFEISEDPAIIYEHEWRLGDLVIWDNWCSIHARKDFPRVSRGCCVP
jgi:taurine dioxygenase